MAHSISRRQQEEHLRRVLAARREHQRPQQQRAIAEAILTVARWNVRVIRGLPVTFYPTVWAAVAARRPVLTCVCPACGVIGGIDLRRYAKTGLVTINRLFPLLTCSRCQPAAPVVRIKGLRKTLR